MCHQSTAKTLAQKIQKKKRRRRRRKKVNPIELPLALNLALHLIPGGWGWPCEVSECGEASAVSVEGDRCAILIVVQKGLWCGGPLALLTGSGNTSTPSTGLFQDHTPRLPWLHRCNFQVSIQAATVPHVPEEHENSPTIFIGFRSMQCCIRYIALSLTTPGAVWSSAVVFDVSSRSQEQSGHRQWDWRLLDPLSWTGASPRPSWRPLWPSTLNESSWALGLAERRKKKPHVQILQFRSVRRIELQLETQQMGHLTEHRERTNLTATMPTCTLNLHLTGTNTH